MAGMNSRWKKGNQRYDEKTMNKIVSRYREGWSWHQGAKVRRRK